MHFGFMDVVDDLFFSNKKPRMHLNNQQIHSTLLQSEEQEKEKTRKGKQTKAKRNPEDKGGRKIPIQPFDLFMIYQLLWSLWLERNEQLII